MTTRIRPATGGVIELSDADQAHIWLDSALGLISRLVLITLALATLAFVLLAISTSAMADALTPHRGSFEIKQRIAFVLAAIITGVACGFLSNRLNKTWAWSRLPNGGLLTAGRAGIRISHMGVLGEDLRIPWPMIKAIAMDSGRNHDDRLIWRRFPLPSGRDERKYLFDTSDEPAANFALIAARPTAPNVAILLNRPVILHNPHSELTKVTFPDRQTVGAPALPPEDHTSTTGLFLRTRNLKHARNLLLPSGKLRALRLDDVH